MSTPALQPDEGNVLASQLHDLVGVQIRMKPGQGLGQLVRPLIKALRLLEEHTETCPV